MIGLTRWHTFTCTKNAQNVFNKITTTGLIAPLLGQLNSRGWVEIAGGGHYIWHILGQINCGSWLKITRGGHYLWHMIGQINSGSWLKITRGGHYLWHMLGNLTVGSWVKTVWGGHQNLTHIFRHWMMVNFILTWWRKCLSAVIYPGQKYDGISY